MAVLLYALLTLMVVIIIACVIFSQKVLNIRVFDTDKIAKLESENGNWDSDTLKRLEKLEKTELSIPSQFGYMIKGWLIHADEPSDRVMIFSHGITLSRYGSLKYMEIFRKRGWNCVLYDHRRHGDTSGRYTTFGYYEKNDLKSVVDWVRDNFSDNTVVGIHGESMGSAIALLYAGMEDGADFYIVDCPYSTLEGQLRYRLKVEYHLPGWLFMPIVGSIIKLRAGFSLSEVAPRNAIQKVQSPILFIHSIKDGYIPVEMTKELYELKNGFKKIYLAENGGHAMAYTRNTQGYEQAVEEFLGDILSNSN